VGDLPPLGCWITTSTPHALARDRLLAERLSDTASPAAASILETLAARMDKAQTSGKLRADANQLDLRVLLCGAALQLLQLGETDPVTWRRYGEMVLTALSPGGVPDGIGFQF
jgi:hypothetical protein